MRFAKYHGTGNDFVMVEDLGDEHPIPPAVIAAICDRHLGIGADGLIRVVRGAGATYGGQAGADFFMDYSNADGQTAEMCGNGIRCLGKLVYERGLTSKQELDVATRGGLKHLVLDVEEGRVRRVTVDMGRPALERGAVPVTGAPGDTFIQQRLEISGRPYRATAVSMGNPHCVLLLPEGTDLAAVDVPAIGAAVEHHPAFPERTNVEFVTVQDGRIMLRVWERGSGETMACGTGACAALVACSLAGLTPRHAEVEFPGGLLDVGWADDGRLFLTGPALEVFAGEVDGAWLAAAGRGQGTSDPRAPARVRS